MELIKKKNDIINDLEDIKKIYYEILIEIDDIILKNLPHVLEIFRSNIEENNTNKNRGEYPGLYSKGNEEPKEFDLFLLKTKEIINNNNNEKKYSFKQLDIIEEIYKNKIQYLEELIEETKEEKSIMVLKSNLNPFNDSFINKYNKIFDHNIFKDFVWDELLSYQIKYLMNIKYDRFVSFWGYNELDKILYNDNSKFIGVLKNLKRLFFFEIKDNTIYEIINNDNSIEFKKNTISFFEIKTNLYKENEFNVSDDLKNKYKNSIIMTFIKNSMRFRNAFIASKVMSGNENINLILIINSKIINIPIYYKRIKKKNKILFRQY